MEERLLEVSDMEGLAVLMRDWKKQGSLLCDMTLMQLLNNASRLIINDEVLLRLQEAYASELLSMAALADQAESSDGETVELIFKVG